MVEQLRSLAERDQSPGNLIRNTARQAANLIEQLAGLKPVQRIDEDAHFDIVDGRMIALPGWRRENLATYLRLMLEATNVTSETDVAGWTDAQCQEADIWACSVHLSASDNDDIIVPHRPSFIPVADRYAGRNPMTGESYA